MTGSETDEIIGLLKSGKYWQYDIAEGFISVYLEHENFILQEYQKNPYSGEISNSRKNVNREELLLLWKPYSKEEIISKMH